MKGSNPERKAKRLARDFGPLADYVRGLDCCACGAHGPSDPAHVKSRGAGGHAFLDNGQGNLVPFCRSCHGLQHSGGWSAVPWVWMGRPAPLDAEKSRLSAEDIAWQHSADFIESGGERY